MFKKSKALYAITDEYLTPDYSVVRQVEKALKSGIDILQYRNKTKSDEDVKDICIELQDLCSRYSVPFIIDDRPHLAQEIGADGLHIGKDDMPLHQAREIFKNGIIGVSCYGSVKKALDAQAEGASYVAFGSFFPSPTKPRSGIVSRSVIQKAKEALDIPVCVIGGISHTNVGEIVKEDPDLVSVVSAVFSGDIEANVKNLLKELKS
jgi:thiamine-phosphate pyrophosphorylase